MQHSNFQSKIVVGDDHIDFQGHVSNVAIVDLMNQATIGHTVAAGFGPKQYQELGGMFVLRRNEVDYTGQAFKGEVLNVETWVINMDGKKAVRGHKISRAKDGRTIAASTNYWIFVGISDGRPRPIPQPLLDTFYPEPSVEANL